MKLTLPDFHALKFGLAPPTSLNFKVLQAIFLDTRYASHPYEKIARPPPPTPRMAANFWCGIWQRLPRFPPALIFDSADPPNPKKPFEPLRRGEFQNYVCMYAKSDMRYPFAMSWPPFRTLHHFSSPLIATFEQILKELSVVKWCSIARIIFSLYTPSTVHVLSLSLYTSLSLYVLRRQP